MTNEHEDKNASSKNWFSALKWEGMRAKDRANEKRANTFAFAWIGLLVGASFLRQSGLVPELVALGLVLFSQSLALFLEGISQDASRSRRDVADAI